MRRFLIIVTFIVSLAVSLVSCVYPFTPEGIEDEVGLIVMEGDINSGIKSTFTPSTSFSLSDRSDKPKYVQLRDIYVESEDGVIYGSYYQSVVEDKNFMSQYKIVYTVDTEDLDEEKRHRLVFKTDEKTYMSGWLSFVKTAPIEDVTYRVADDKSYLEVLVSTTGINDSLKYYKWDYREDWEIHSQYLPDGYFYPDSNQVYPIYDYEDYPSNYYCWNKSLSTNINIFSTENLSQNIVKDHVVRRIPNNDKRLSYIYAIEVYQKALSKDAYIYWETILKNNDGSAGIFAPQPNEMKGNLYCVEDPNEIVLGYISSCAVEKKRIFIDRTEHQIYVEDDVCLLEAVEPSKWKAVFGAGWLVVSLDPLSGEVLWSPRKCVDCRVYGNKTKPSFWPNDDK